jgi:hypothetical protein
MSVYNFDVIYSSQKEFPTEKKSCFVCVVEGLLIPYTIIETKISTSLYEYEVDNFVCYAKKPLSLDDIIDFLMTNEGIGDLATDDVTWIKK